MKNFANIFAGGNTSKRLLSFGTAALFLGIILSGCSSNKTASTSQTQQTQQTTNSAQTSSGTSTNSDGTISSISKDIVFAPPSYRDDSSSSLVSDGKGPSNNPVPSASGGNGSNMPASNPNGSNYNTSNSIPSNPNIGPNGETLSSTSTSNPNIVPDGKGGFNITNLPQLPKVNATYSVWGTSTITLNVSQQNGLSHPTMVCDVDITNGQWHSTHCSGNADPFSNIPNNTSGTWTASLNETWPNGSSHLNILCDVMVMNGTPSMQNCTGKTVPFNNGSSTITAQTNPNMAYNFGPNASAYSNYYGDYNSSVYNTSGLPVFHNGTSGTSNLPVFHGGTSTNSNIYGTGNYVRDYPCPAYMPAFHGGYMLAPGCY